MLVYSNSIAYGSAILSLFVIDYMLGHGFVDAVRKTLCRMICFVKRIIKEESKTVQTAPDMPLNLPVLVVEILLLSLIIAVCIVYYCISECTISIEATRMYEKKYKHFFQQLAYIRVGLV